MYQVTDPIKFGDNDHVRVYYDESYYSADELLGDGFGMFATKLDRHFRKSALDFGEFTDDLNLLANRISYHQYESAFGKFLNLAGKHYRTIVLQGSSQSDWAEVMVYSDEDFILTPEFRSALKSWFSGDIYHLVHERREIYTNADGTKTIDNWEHVDSICGIITEDYNELIPICRDTFDLPKEAN